MLKFQTYMVDGKPRIFIEKESTVNEHHTFGYKQKEQRFSLRHSNNKAPIANSTTSKKPWGANISTKKIIGADMTKKSASKPVTVAAQKSKKTDVNSVTLTQEQLAAILASVGQINSDRKNIGVDISLDTKDNKIDIKARRRDTVDEELSDDRDSALGEDSDYTSSPRDEKVQQSKSKASIDKHKSKSTKPSEENVMSLLKSGDSKSSNLKKHGRKTSNVAVMKVDESSEERMRRLIEQNIDKLSEEELIDLLADVYMEEHRLDLKTAEKMDKESGIKSRKGTSSAESSSKPVRGIRKSKTKNADGEAAPDRGKVTRWAAEVDSTKLKDKPYKKHGVEVGKSALDDNRSSSMSNEEGERSIRKMKKTTKKHKADNVEDDRESVEHKSSPTVENKELSTDVVAPVINLSTAEKMKLKWAQEKAELTKLSQQSGFDPWGRPGCGAPLSPRKDNTLSNPVVTQQQSVVETRRDEKVKSRDERAAQAPSNVAGLQAESLQNAARDLNQPFVRGGGLDLMHADAKTLAELEDKRRRQQEHQEAVRQQVEERARQRSAERRRQLAEEAEEERRISLEHNSMARQFETEHERAQRKKNEDEQRLAQLNETFLAAEQRAREEKVARRLRQLERGGHDTTALRANLTARSLDNLFHPSLLETQLAPVTVRSVEHFTDWPAASAQAPTAKQIAVQTETTLLEREGRPPPVPHSQRAPVVKTRAESRFKEHVHTHLPLEQEHAEALDTHRSYESAGFGVHERPGWNERRPGKRAIKQSEKDPNYQRNRSDREVRRRQRQNFLLTQIDPQTGRVVDANVSVQGRRSQSPLNNTTRRPPSPPVPAVRHKLEDEKFYHPSTEVTSLPAGEFLRTFDVLDPGVAAQPLPVSRENTARMAARQAYIQGLNPAHFGKYMESLDDRRVEKTLPQRRNKDPIFNPGLVLDQPTLRQDAILAQLSNIRKGLLMRQKEIENSLTQNDNL